MEQLDDILDNFRLALSPSPAELRLFFGAVAGLTVLLVLIFTIQSFAARRSRARMGRDVYYSLVERFGLSRSEQALVNRLVRYCRPPAEQYRVLLEQRTFDACVARLKEVERVSDTTLASVRLKLELGARQLEGVPASTSELPLKTRIVLVQASGGQRKCFVVRQDADALVLRLTEEHGTPPEPGMPVRLYFHNRAGLYVFSSYTRHVRGRSVYVDHSENIKRTQRRRYYRRVMQLAIAVSPYGSGQDPVTATMLDLGGGGMSLTNPGLDLKSGQRLALSFTASGAQFSLVGRIVRISGQGKILHVEFEGVGDSTRDKLIGSILRAHSSL